MPNGLIKNNKLSTVNFTNCSKQWKPFVMLSMKKKITQIHTYCCPGYDIVSGGPVPSTKKNCLFFKQHEFYSTHKNGAHGTENINDG